MSTNEIASALGYKRRTNTLRAVISEMLETGEVAYLYPEKPNSRNQKICLAKGSRAPKGTPFPFGIRSTSDGKLRGYDSTEVIYDRYEDPDLYKH